MQQVEVTGPLTWVKTGKNGQKPRNTQGSRAIGTTEYQNEQSSHQRLSRTYQIPQEAKNTLPPVEVTEVGHAGHFPPLELK